LKIRSIFDDLNLVPYFLVHLYIRQVDLSLRVNHYLISLSGRRSSHKAAGYARILLVIVSQLNYTLTACQ